MKQRDKLYCGGLSAVSPAKQLAVWLVLCFCLWLPRLVSGATLTGYFAPLPAGGSIDLTAAGALDWAHWGMPTESCSNFKYGVPRQISYSLITDEWLTDGPYLLETGPADFTWTDGAPSRSAANTTNGVSIFGDRLPGNIPTGFRIRCSADTTLRRLTVYVGTSGGKATLRASLNGAPLLSDTTFDGLTGPLEGAYHLSFLANAPGEFLTVNFESSDTAGYIFLKAAILEGADSPPTVAVSSPADGSVMSAPLTFSVTASAADSDGIITNLVLLSGTTLLTNVPGGTLTCWLSNAPAGAHAFTAVATDNRGLSVTSFPSSVYLTTGGGTLLGSVAVPPGRVNLTSEGTADWVHWGLSSPTSVDRKAGVIQRIPNVELLNATVSDLIQYSDNRIACSWDDGTPTAQAVDNTTGIFLFSTNNPPAAFQLTVPATNKVLRLKLYLGLFGAGGKLSAWMTDWSAPPFFDTSVYDYYDSGRAVYTFRFASPNPSASLRINWTPTLVFVPGFGNLTWQSATLQAEPDPPVLKVVPPPSPNQFALSFLASTGMSYTVQFADGMFSPNWQTLTNFDGAGAEVLAIDPEIGPAQRFYRVLVE